MTPMPRPAVQRNPLAGSPQQLTQILTDWAGPNPTPTAVRGSLAACAALWRAWTGEPIPERIIDIIRGLADDAEPMPDPIDLYERLEQWRHDRQRTFPNDSLTQHAYTAVVATTRAWSEWTGLRLHELGLAEPVGEYLQALFARILQGTDR